jgi:hypothetical protein
MITVIRPIFAETQEFGEELAVFLNDKRKRDAILFLFTRH